MSAPPNCVGSTIARAADSDPLNHAPRRPGSVSATWRGAILGIAIALAIFASTTEAGANTGPAPSEDLRWVLSETEHFRILSDASSRRSLAVARELETLHAVLSSIAAEQRSGPKTQVYAFASEDLFRNYSPWPQRNDVAGFFTSGLLRNYLAIDLSARSGSRPIYHEYLHEFTATNFPGVPLWFNEGLAEYYSTFETDARLARIGEPIQSHLRTLANLGAMPLADLFAIDSQSAEYHEGERAGAFYASAWAVVHYLLSDAERIAEMAQFLDALRHGRDLDRAFEESFGTSFAGLEEAVDRYVRLADFPTLRLQLDAFPRATLNTMDVSPAQAWSLLGELLAVHPQRLEAAADHFRQALAEDPAQAQARAGLGWIAWKQGVESEALELLRGAATNSDDAEPRLVLGLVLLQKLLAEADPTQVTTEQLAWAHEAQDALRSALAAEPNWPRALVALGLTHLFAGDSKDGLRTLNRALEARPADPMIGFGLAGLTARFGAFPQAWEAAQRLETLMATLPDGEQHVELFSTTRRLVGAFQVRRAMQALEDDELPLAGSLVVDLEERLDGPEWREFGGTLAGLRQNLIDRRNTAAYNAAVELANHGDTRGALATIESLLEEPELDPGLRQLGAQTATQLRAVLDRRAAPP